MSLHLINNYGRCLNTYSFSSNLSEFTGLVERLLGGIRGRNRRDPPPNGERPEKRERPEKSEKSETQRNKTAGRKDSKEKRPPPQPVEEEEQGPGRSLKVLANFVEATAEKGPDAIVKEYLKIDPFCDPTATFNEFKANITKNRYTDVLCVDSTRVRLTFGGGDDYIHANEIQNSMLISKFICTQGPLTNTVYDFWRMVFQERAQSIMMLCRPAEDGRPKCVVYWPETVGDKMTLPPALTVTNSGEEQDEFSTVTLLIELNEDYDASTLPEAMRRPLYVKLLRWTSWPDRGVPDEASCMIPLRLLDRVRHAPCIVHCSAGIGRTGSMMVLEVALQMIASGKNVDVEKITRELRRSRCQCVQTEVQYLYIHRVLVENALGHINLEPKAMEAAKKFLQAYDVRMGTATR